MNGRRRSFHLGARAAAVTAAAGRTRFSLGGGAGAAAVAVLTPAQALVQAFQANPGLVDALLLFDPAHYSTLGSSPGVLVDALGGPITYTAPNTQATPDAVQDASGWWYASADGVDDTLIASADQTVRWYCAVFRSAPGQTSNWNNFGAPFSGTIQRLGLLDAYGTDWWVYQPPRAVSRDGIVLSPRFDMAPISDWMVVSVSVWMYDVTVLEVMQLLCTTNAYFLHANLAALALRYTDPTSAQQTQIESLLTPMQQALLNA